MSLPSARSGIGHNLCFVGFCCFGFHGCEVSIVSKFYSDNKQQKFQDHKNGRQGIAACRASWAILDLYHIYLIFLMENKTVGRDIDTKKYSHCQLLKRILLVIMLGTDLHGNFFLLPQLIV